jgi:hypothetical protein
MKEGLNVVFVLLYCQVSHLQESMAENPTHFGFDGLENSSVESPRSL